MPESPLASFPIPDRLARAFQERTAITLAEAANALETDQKQLRAEVKAGKVKYVLRGQSQTRKLRRFLLVDLLEYLNGERRQECPSTSARTPRSTGASLQSGVIEFDALRAKLIAGRRKSPKRG